MLDIRARLRAFQATTRYGRSVLGRMYKRVLCPCMTCSQLRARSLEGAGRPDVPF